MGMKSVSKFNGALVVKFQLFRLVTDLHAAAVLSPTVIQAWLFTIFSLYEAYVPLSYTPLLGEPFLNAHNQNWRATSSFLLLAAGSSFNCT
eukprot:1150130-Pelagomonas_calceolata.AAC.1